jgi:hypothetical protein
MKANAPASSHSTRRAKQNKYYAKPATLDNPNPNEAKPNSEPSQRSNISHDH